MIICPSIDSSSWTMSAAMSVTWLTHVTFDVLRAPEVSARMGGMSSSASSVDDLSWDQRIFQLIDPGVDGTLIAENLRRTPTERLRRMQEMARFLEHARCDRRPATP
jgi:hypothetical protein